MYEIASLLVRDVASGHSQWITSNVPAERAFRSDAPGVQSQLQLEKGEGETRICL